MKGRNLLTLAEFSKEEIIKILDLADKFKEQRKNNVLKKILSDKTLAMIFHKPSTRTRVSFDVAMNDLGGNSITLNSNEIQLSRGETIEDTAKSFSRYVDVIMARVHNHRDVDNLAKYASIPVINGLSDIYHPTQVLADLQTIREKKGKLEGLKLTWIGDGNNVCNTLLIGCSRMGINMQVASPSNYKPNREAYEIAKRSAEKNRSRIEVINDPKEAIKDADIVVTDTFISMGSDSERKERLKAFLPEYQVDIKLMNRAKKNAIFMHCLPSHRGEEVTDGVIDGAKSIVWDEAENRLHSQKALLAFLLLDEDSFQ
ncbi:MAG TPA: ornithine carbamoyltransferase [Nitrososphaerales archaeon]|jgi:ornithine carbamoyltransferase|nr:ornithine carbamoyltransferase [Nitrososphaerales archaeon]|tara:strand:- start:15332 stop:16276 length:945 start_codon:yes stop_codon:yes gene_type:complete